MIKSNRSNRSRDSHKELSKKETGFGPYDVTAETAETAVLLLESQETEILCRTLRAITKFTEHEVQNREALYNLKVLRYLLPHVEHPELNVRRFALKALAQICQLPHSPYQVLSDSRNLKKIASMLVQDEDMFVLEFASLVLSELTKEPLGCDQMMSADVLDRIFYRMRTCADPDVQNNCTQILSNLISDPSTASEVTSSQHFSWPPLLDLLKSGYIQLQKLALNTVDQLICRHKDQLVQETFRASTGIQDLCDLFEAYEFRDIHVDVLQVLKHYAETEENAAHVYRSGCLQRLLKYLGEALPATKPHCLAVLTRMSHTAKGRDALHATGTDVTFCEQLVQDDAGLVADAALGVANMAQLPPAAAAMMDTNVIETLFAILSDEAAPWFDRRVRCLLAVRALGGALPAAAAAALHPAHFTVLRNINRHFEQNPLEAQRLAVQCYDSLLEYDCGLRAMLNVDFIRELIAILKRVDILLKIRTCYVLVGLMRDHLAREMFTDCHGEAVVAENLRLKHVGLRVALCSLVCAGVTTRSADVYLGLGTVHYMFCHKRARYSLAAWETALQALFDHHPSAKFGYTNGLDINDNTRDCFYVQKHPTACFPTLSSLMSSPTRRHPVFVANFNVQPPAGRAGVQQVTDSQDGQAPVWGEHAGSPVCVPLDANLRNYERRLREMFSVHPAPNELRRAHAACPVPSSLARRARALGVFVGVQMCGLTQEMDCALPSVHLHLAELMVALNSCVVGLGRVRCGAALERAVLFKVLADRLALPCALRRGPARAWCEVAVPDGRPTEAHEERLYPGGLLRANYVVDLLDDPGALHPPHSEEARRIRGY